MKIYELELKKKGFKTVYVDYAQAKNGFKGISNILALDPVDFIAKKRLEAHPFKVEFLNNPGFLTTQTLEDATHYSFTPFYIEQRKKFGILLDATKKPIGGKWTYDTENRKKAPKNFIYPPLPTLAKTKEVVEAIEYVEKNFPDHYGTTDRFNYPVDSKQAQQWLRSFLNDRFSYFGIYQDAISEGELSMMHSILTPSLNIGLLTPSDILEAALECDVPLNSKEGFIRQILGWREFIKQVYIAAGVKQRTTNYWNHTRKIPHSFYTATTGILPIDETIKKLTSYAYCHHIERLMVLGNFMLLCEFDPTEVYRWFMELSIDSYDWVMVPNVYGMSQYADGGLMTTKPYISSSNYILKMSNYPKGPWCEIWDSLFWRFMKKHRPFFEKQPRLSLLTKQLDKMDSSKFTPAESFLKLI